MCQFIRIPRILLKASFMLQNFFQFRYLGLTRKQKHSKRHSAGRDRHLLQEAQGHQKISCYCRLVSYHSTWNVSQFGSVLRPLMSSPVLSRGDNVIHVRLYIIIKIHIITYIYIYIDIKHNINTCQPIGGTNTPLPVTIRLFLPHETDSSVSW